METVSELLCVLQATCRCVITHGKTRKERAFIKEEEEEEEGEGRLFCHRNE